MAQIAEEMTVVPKRYFDALVRFVNAINGGDSSEQEDATAALNAEIVRVRAVAGIRT